MIVLNFGHPLNAECLKLIGEMLENPTIGEVKEIRVQINQDQPLSPQVVPLIKGIGWSSNQWQNGQFVVILPGLSAATAVVLAEIHGRSGYFPAIIRLRPVGGPPAKFEPCEVINLAAVRDTARHTR